VFKKSYIKIKQIACRFQKFFIKISCEWNIFFEE